MPGVTTIATFPVAQVLEKVGEKGVFNATVNGKKYAVRVSSVRLRTFKENIECVCCGRVGNVMGLDMPNGQDRPHFNLYCKERKRRILMTKDHIIPKSRGGSNHISNMQTMCTRCNAKKGSKSPEEYNVYLESRTHKKSV